MDYHTYIASAEWRRRRAAVLLRARGRCERCSLWPVVNVHHVTYANLGNESLCDLLGVCRKCHRELHGD